MKHIKILLTALLVISFLSSCFKQKRSDNAGEKMQEFIIAISDYARQTDSDFIIIPQNGAELCYNYCDISDGFNQSYLYAIDGLGIEELFYNGTYAPDNERLDMLRQLKDEKKILVSEFVSDNSLIDDAYTADSTEGFACFVRTAANYDYLQIPEVIPNENNNDITALSQIQNYLYLISTDNFSSKQDMIDAIAATNFDLVIIDLFFDDTEFTSSEIAMLKTKANGAKRLVISYISIGSAEKYRYYWKKSWVRHFPCWIKKRYDGYPDEFWVKFWNNTWQEIIYGNDDSYMKKILNAGFDGAYLDNVEAYYFLYFKD